MSYWANLPVYAPSAVPVPGVPSVSMAPPAAPSFNAATAYAPMAAPVAAPGSTSLFSPTYQLSAAADPYTAAASPTQAVSLTPTNAHTQVDEPVVTTLLQEKRASEKGLARYRGFIEVHVGKDGTEVCFDIHESLITARSLFFKLAMSGKWKESDDRRVNLPEDDPDTFHVYVNLLYTGVLAVVPDPVPARYAGLEERLKLAKLYVLAEKLQDTATKNVALEAMLVACRKKFDGQSRVPGRETIKIVYEGTPDGSNNAPTHSRSLYIPCQMHFRESEPFDRSIPPGAGPQLVGQAISAF